jgi:hypothetical protein
VPEQESVEVPLVVVLLNAILDVDKVQVNPVEGETDTPSETVPVKPCWAVTVMVEVPDAPARAVTLVGLATILKSCTM